MIDLHVHSTASDGTFRPSQLAAMGKSYTLMAITDHDNCDGVDEFLAASAIEGALTLGQYTTRDPAPIRLAGVELSIEPGEGYRKFHLLGLGINHRHPRLHTFLNEIRAGRNERNMKIIEKLAALGMPITMDELRKYANGQIIARPHIARVLMDHGWVSSVKDAFDRILGDGCPGYVTRYHPDQAKAIETIHACGGAAIMAHPRYWTNDPKMLRDGLKRLKDLGLDGIEAVYQANEMDETIDHLRAARELGLAVTAGSDFHGQNKPTIPLGMTVDEEETFIAPLLEAMDRYAEGYDD